MSQPMHSFDTIPNFDGFPYLGSIIERYQQHVHYLEDPVADRILNETEERLGMKLPPYLRKFYSKWNGGDLFKSNLQIRKVMQLTVVNKNNKHIILFAHQEGGPKWVYTEDGAGGFVFGTWTQETFQPLFSSFSDWLDCCLHYFAEGPFVNALEEYFKNAESKDYLKIERAKAFLEVGKTKRALKLLQGISTEQGLVPARILLGDALFEQDSEAAINCYEEALRLLSFPLPYQEYVPSTAWLSRLEELSDPESLRLDLLILWNEGISEPRSQYECELIEQIVLMLQRLSFQKAWNSEGEERTSYLSSILGFSKITEIKGAGLLIEARERLLSWSLGYSADALQLEIAKMYFFYGEYDWAEQQLRTLHNASKSIQDQRSLLIGRIISQQKENWGLDILFPILESSEDPKILAEACLLSARYYLRFGEQEQASQALEEVKSFLLEIRSPSLEAEYLLIQGLLFSEENLINAAFDAFTKAEIKARQAMNVLLCGEALVHKGDVYRRSLGDAKAVEYYRAARELFADNHCLFGWERVSFKLGELIGNGTQILESYKIAKSIDDVQGVLQAEQALKDLGIEHKEGSILNWFLQEIKKRQGERNAAQRSKAPFLRKDADRPERRLSNIRNAFALCDESILDELKDKILFYLPKLQESELSSSNHDLLDFLAALDLVTAHQSSKAVEIILQIIEKGDLTGLAKQGFVQILSRTKNIPVSVGLLSFLSDSESDFLTKLMAIEILGWRRERSALPLIVEILHQSKSIKMRRQVILSLGRIGDRSVVPDLLEYIDDTVFSTEISLSLLLLGEHSALDWHAQSLASGIKGKNVHLGQLVGRYGGSAYLLLLKNIIQNHEEAEILQHAIHGLGYLGDCRVVPFLIELTGFREESMSKAASEALELITGHYEGIDEFLLRNRWREWWKEMSYAFKEGHRYRSGKEMSPELLIAALKDDDLLVRLAAYDELVISTGTQLSFDAEGDWWAQQKQISAWENWWTQNQQNVVAGRWYFDGRLL